MYCTINKDKREVSWRQPYLHSQAMVVVKGSSHTELLTYKSVKGESDDGKIGI